MSAVLPAVPRGSRAEVRNPLLRLPSVAGLQRLPLESRVALAALLRDLRRDALSQADYCWRKHKAPMAAYWKAVAVYAGHTARVLSCPTT